MKWIAILSVLFAALPSAQAQTMQSAFTENCPRSVMADPDATRLYCACVHRQIMETTVFPEDREASFALIGPSETLADMSDHAATVAKLPMDVQKAMEGQRQTVLQVIMPLCLMSAVTGKVLPDGTMKE
jgi:glutamate mutase epsilon subunit